MEMKDNKKAVCACCGRKLSKSELADNIYAGLDVKDYTCYGCQPDIDEDDSEDEIDVDNGY